MDFQTSRFKEKIKIFFASRNYWFDFSWKKLNSKQKTIKLAVVFCVLFFFFCILSLLPRNISGGEEVVFCVENGQGSKEISVKLANENLILWGPALRLYALFSGNSKNLQAGVYLISAKMSIPEIVSKIQKGETMKARIVIPEGYNSEQIYEKMAGIAQLDVDDLKANEGYLFPDTYEIAYGDTGEKIIKMMKDNFDSKVTEDLTTEISKQGKTLQETVIMASMLEKEVISYEDKQIVAGILWKRLGVGMPLQVDATVA
jgi:UPF0755 protein